MSTFLINKQVREQKLLNWLSVGLLVFVSAFIWAPSRDGLEGIYALTFFIPMVLLFISKLSSASWRRLSVAEFGGAFTLLALLYGGYGALSSIWSTTHDTAFFGLQWCILATWLCGSSWVAYHQRLDIATLLRLLIWMAAASSLLNLLWFYASHEPLVRLEGITVNRNSNNIGSVFGIVTLLAYIAWLQAKGRTESFIAFGLLAVIGLSLLASQSRANFLAFALLAPVACYWAKPSAAKLWLQLGLIAGALVLFALFPLVTEGVLLERGASLRDSIWSEVWQSIQSGPMLLGTGLEKEGRIVIGDLGVFNHAHNAWLDTWYRTGLVGLLLSVAYLAYVYRSLFVDRGLFKSPELFPLYLWLSYGCIYCFFDARGFFWQLDPKWFCMWVPAGLIAAVVTRTSIRTTHSGR